MSAHHSGERRWVAAGVVLVLWGLCPALGWATGTCTPEPGSCNAPEPDCGKKTFGVDSCGAECMKKGAANTCDAPAPTCDTRTTTGTKFCDGSACTKKMSLGKCIQSGSIPACPTPIPGTTRYCSDPCEIANPCGATWAPYGYALPGDPLYGFPEVKKSGGTPLYPDPATQDLFGLAAKGNIVIGDYTSDAFKSTVVPLLRPGPDSKTQPYVVDGTDVDLGYGNANVCNNQQPCFNGDYTAVDKDGIAEVVRSDGTMRHFYESTLTDDAFRHYLSMPSGNDNLTVSAVLYTNHALTGAVTSNGRTIINGALVSRDDGLVVNGPLQINHDIRLLSDNTSALIALPLSLKRPSLLGVEECATAGCA